MTTLAEFMIIAGADNRPPMLEKSMYDSWKSRMELYIENRENRIMILNSVLTGSLVWHTVDEENGNQVKDDAQATQKTNAPIPSSSISSDYAAKFLNFDNIPPTDTEVISMMDINVQHELPCTSSLLTIHVSVIHEQDVINPSETVTTTLAPAISLLLSSLYPALQQIAPIPTPTTTEATTSTTNLKDVDNSTKVLSTIKSEVPNSVKEYLGSSLDNALHKQYTHQKSIKDIREIKMEHARKHPKQRALYHALMESIVEDEDAMDEGVVDKLKKRKPDDANKDEGASARSDRGLKRQKTSKDTEPSKKAKSIETLKGTSKSQPKSTGKSAQAEEIVFEAGDTQGPQNLGEDMGNTDEPPVVNVDLKDWFKKLERPPTPDPESNKGKSVENKPTLWNLK
ncbi:hypothetical protein Tco_1015960 [Tanacetum coccineum]|uniref:Integrase, catalytic region, zinc finger, CCHC-type, peptidase aspartic, catalytic n=1 Tax=Tanacetum coccineum TaxID=301880 RepID=A0ABQ5FMF1_9ASTR